MILWWLASQLAWSAPYTLNDAQAIVQIEAQRMPPAALQHYVDHEEPMARARAARALGRLRTPAALPALRILIDDPSATVRAEAAFALGQTPGGGMVAQDHFLQESDPIVQERLCEALGKLGGSASIGLLITALDHRPPPLHRPTVSIAAAHALGRLARRDVNGVAAPAVLHALIRQLDRFDVDARHAAAYALSQIRPAAPPDAITEALLHTLSTSGDPEIRKWMLLAIMAIDFSPEQWHSLLLPLRSDPNAAVRIAVARVAGHVNWPEMAPLLADPTLAVRLEAIEAAGQITDIDHGQYLLTILQQGATLDAAEAMRTEDNPQLLEAVAAFTALGTSPHPEVVALLGNRDAYLQPQRPGRIRAAAAGMSTDIDRLVALAQQDGELPVRTAAAVRLSSLPDVQPSTMHQLLTAFDPMVVAVAADWLQEHPIRANERLLLDVLDQYEEVEVLAAATRALVPLYEGTYPIVRTKDPRSTQHLQHLQLHTDASVRAAARSLASSMKRAPTNPIHHVVTVSLSEVAAHRFVRIHTARGIVTATLYPEDAPLTVWNFIQLAEDGFYDGLPAHRVLADFVVQHGDPRGDGTGGPGWSIPDEINPHRHRQGALSMAHSGADTGGSQWFVTLSDQPHLDGVHTVFGHVQTGMHVLQDMRPGDRILRVEVSESPSRQ